MANEEGAGLTGSYTTVGNGRVSDITYNTDTYPSANSKDSSKSNTISTKKSSDYVKSDDYMYGAKYFAGQNVKIFFGDIFVDEINALNFSLTEQVAPIYGYASNTWDAVARGTRLIEGSFSINFTEASYLYLTLTQLTKRLRQNITKSESKDSASAPALFNPSSFKKNITLEQALSSKYSAQTSNFEKALWGAQDSEYEYMSRNNNRQKDTHFYPLYINAKKTVTGEETVYYESSHKELRDHGFNILISYGGLDQNCFGDGSTAHTLMNVQLTGVQQVIDGSGNPIEEVYTFIAKDLDGNVNNKY